ncbi:MAG TPA: ABC transporter substrate-binding protein [Syntrophales bacterium]|nr:ABC transporter substrate-binding protein [Syntrophales bacterium]HOL58637.1 ABC transporter substrate-binding protein [Syntrophales bacterium]HPO35075.1 ABC transporter substrate-binding protein [Syntrophales bacterium]
MKGGNFFKSIFLWLIFLVLGIVFFTGGVAFCAKWDGTIYFGYTGPLSGGAAKYGNNCLTGMKVAVDDVNAAGGINIGGKKYELKLVYYDDMYKPANTVANARRMVMAEKPILIACPHAGGILALEKINEKEGFLISGYTTNVAIISQGNKLVFSVPPRADLAYGVEMLKKAFSFGPKLAHLTGSHEAGVAWKELSEANWKKMGGQVVASDSVNYSAVTDFFPYLTKIIQAKPDVINLYGPSEPSAMIVNQARQLGYKGGFLMGDQCKLDEMAKVASMANLNNSVGVCPFELRPLPIAKAFGKRLHQMFGKDYVPTFEAAAHYEVVWIVVKAMEKAQIKDDPYAIFKKFNDVLPVGQYANTLRDGLGPNGELLGVTFAIMVKDNQFSKPIPLIWGQDLYPPGKKSAWKD